MFFLLVPDTIKNNCFSVFLDGQSKRMTQILHQDNLRIRTKRLFWVRQEYGIRWRGNVFTIGLRADQITSFPETFWL